jgi:hypothetical protein
MIVLFNRGQMIEALQTSAQCAFVIAALFNGSGDRASFQPTIGAAPFRINPIGGKKRLTAQLMRVEMLRHIGQQEAAMRSMLLSSAVMLALAAVPVQAQVTIDVAKINCDQYLGFKVADPRDVAIWLSGYYSGKRGTAVLETQVLVEHSRKLQDYCIRNPQVPVMQAVETLFGAAR